MREEENKGRKATKRRKRAKRKLTKFAYFLILFMAALCASAVCVAVFFKVDTISVTGKSSYTNAQIVSASGIKTGTNLFRIQKEDAIQKICSSLPFVADAEIKLSPPSGVKIKITADTPKYVIKLSKEYAYTDENLKALESRADTKKYTGVITITGAEITNFKPGTVISLKDKTQLKTIKNIAAAIKEVGLAKVTGIDVTDSYQLSVIYDSRISIIIGTSLRAGEKLQDAAAIIKSEIEATDKGSLDVSVQNRRYTFSPS